METISKWITDLNVKCKIIKPLEDNTGENLDDLGYSDDLLYKTPNHNPCKKESISWTLLKLKICSAKKNVTRTRRQVSDGENICKDTSDKGLLSKIYKGLLKLNNQKMNNLNENGEKTWTETSSKKINGWQISIKDARPHMSLGKCKLQQLWDEIPLHTCENGQNQKHWQHQMLGRMWNSRNSCSWLTGARQNSTATLEDNLEFSFRTRHTLTVSSSNHAPWYLSKWTGNISTQKLARRCL